MRHSNRQIHTYTITHKYTHGHTLMIAIGDNAMRCISLKNQAIRLTPLDISPPLLLTPLDIVASGIVLPLRIRRSHSYSKYIIQNSIGYSIFAYRPQASNAFCTCQCIRFESLTLKMKVKDVVDLDENWRANVP